MCLKADPLFGCVWCKGENRCTLKQHCPHPENQWLEHNGINSKCTHPRITKVEHAPTVFITYLKIDIFNIFDYSLSEKLHSVVSVSQPAVWCDRISDGMYTLIKGLYNDRQQPQLLYISCFEITTLRLIIHLIQPDIRRNSSSFLRQAYQHKHQFANKMSFCSSLSRVKVTQ